MMNKMVVKVGVVATSMVGGLIIESGMNKLDTVIQRKIIEMPSKKTVVKTTKDGETITKVKLNKTKIAYGVGLGAIQGTVVAVALVGSGLGYSKLCDTLVKEAIADTCAGIVAGLALDGFGTKKIKTKEEKRAKAWAKRLAKAKGTENEDEIIQKIMEEIQQSVEEEIAKRKTEVKN